jgi:hypothetical protein
VVEEEVLKFEEEWERLGWSLVSVGGTEWALEAVMVAFELEFLRWGGIYDIVLRAVKTEWISEVEGGDKRDRESRGVGGFWFWRGVFWKPNLFSGPTFQWAVMDHFRFRSYLSF